MEFFFREPSWDRGIFATVLKGEYGALDFSGKVVVDIGAHIGSFSVLATRLGAQRVFAFEAGADNFECLLRNCGALPSIECHYAAVWRSDCPDTTLSWRPSSIEQNTGGGSVLDVPVVAGCALSDQTSESVRTVSLDSVIERVGHVDLLKIDAEGSEYPILMTSRLLDRVTEIVGEYHVLDGTVPARPLGVDRRWTVRRLMRHLSNCGFATSFQTNVNNGLFRARRRAV
jgi:FkbM family methyltransferase